MGEMPIRRPQELRWLFFHADLGVAAQMAPPPEPTCRGCPGASDKMVIACLVSSITANADDFERCRMDRQPRSDIFVQVEADPSMVPDDAIIQSWGNPTALCAAPKTQSGTMTYLVNRYAAGGNGYSTD